MSDENTVDPNAGVAPVTDQNEQATPSDAPAEAAPEAAPDTTPTGEGEGDTPATEETPAA